ncbi:hypothetical protein P4C99_16705 [Pontiellaceae bacterium B1224]|nr:hypothetical protein [Pontiellaceae bacterium B1224]
MPETIVKPLGKITAILADLGLEVTYAYDDLVFVQHSAFLLQFTDEPTTLKLFINTECEPDVATEVQSNMLEAHAKAGYSLIPSGQFTISENEGETLDLTFS